MRTSLRICWWHVKSHSDRSSEQYETTCGGSGWGCTGTFHSPCTINTYEPGTQKIYSGENAHESGVKIWREHTTNAVFRVTYIWVILQAFQFNLVNWLCYHVLAGSGHGSWDTLRIWEISMRIEMLRIVWTQNKLNTMRMDCGLKNQSNMWTRPWCHFSEHGGGLSDRF